MDKSDALNAKRLPHLKTARHREQQDCGQQVSHALAEGLQAQHPQRAWGQGPGPPAALEAQRSLVGQWEATLGHHTGTLGSHVRAGGWVCVC